MSRYDEWRLDPETHARIFNEEVLPRSGFYKTTPQANPRAIVLAGQPGAGKGTLERAARREFANNVITVDPDQQRERHSEVEKFRETNPYTWSDKTHSDASRWGTELRDKGAEGRRNMTLDTTLGNADAAVSMIKDLQGKHHYQVEVRVMATHWLESELGVDQRFTKAFDKDGHARYVPKPVRSAVYEALPANLDRVHAETGARISIYNREGALLYDSNTSQQRPSEALIEAREARLRDPAITKQVSREWQKQTHWHEDLPETLNKNPHASPATKQNLPPEHLRLQIGPDVLQYSATAQGVDRTVRIEPAARVVMGLQVAGTAAMAYDAVHTGLEVKRNLEADNLTGAQSDILHFASRNLSMVAGGIAGAKLGAAAGIETGPGALATGLVGGIVGMAGGTVIANAADQARIYNQQDTQGNTWHHDPAHLEKGWTREVQARSINAPTGYTAQTLYADAPLTDRLNYQASSKAFELARPSEPQNPYRQPPSKEEQHSLSRRYGDWERDAKTQDWHRSVTAPQGSRGQVRTWSESANAETRAQLNQAAQDTLAHNAANTPQAIAQRYQSAYDSNGWSRHGPMPEAVRTAQNDNKLSASDGREYARNAQGHWSTTTWYGRTTRPEGNVRDELDGTEQQVATLQRAHITQARTNPVPDAPPSPEAKQIRSLSEEVPARQARLQAARHGGDAIERGQYAQQLQQQWRQAPPGPPAPPHLPTQPLAQPPTRRPTETRHTPADAQRNAQPTTPSPTERSTEQQAQQYQQHQHLQRETQARAEETERQAQQAQAQQSASEPHQRRQEQQQEEQQREQRQEQPQRQEQHAQRERQQPEQREQHQREKTPPQDAPEPPHAQRPASPPSPEEKTPPTPANEQERLTRAQREGAEERPQQRQETAAHPAQLHDPVAPQSQAARPPEQTHDGDIAQRPSQAAQNPSPSAHERERPAIEPPQETKTPPTPTLVDAHAREPQRPQHLEAREPALADRMDSPTHAGHAMYRQALAGMEKLDAQYGRTPDERTRQGAACLAAQARDEGLTGIDHVVLSSDANTLFAAQGRLDSPFKRVTQGVDTVKALDKPLAQSTQAFDQAYAQQQERWRQEQQAHEQKLALADPDMQESVAARAPAGVRNPMLVMHLQRPQQQPELGMPPSTDGGSSAGGHGGAGGASGASGSAGGDGGGGGAGGGGGGGG